MNIILNILSIQIILFICRHYGGNGCSKKGLNAELPLPALGFLVRKLRVFCQLSNRIATCCDCRKKYQASYIYNIFIAYIIATPAFSYC